MEVGDYESSGAYLGETVIVEQGDGIEYKFIITSIGEEKTIGLHYSSIPLECTSVDVPKYVLIEGIQYDVTSIGANSLSNKGFESVSIPDSVIVIGDYAFSGCTNLKSITIPDSVTSIGDRVFTGCTCLETIVIGAGVSSIDIGAFSGCTGLESITIGAGVSSIYEFAFSGCTNLKSITVDEDNESFLQSDGMLYDLTRGRIIIVLADIEGDIDIPDGITSIGSAFSGCAGLTSITIPNTVTSIGDQAFSGCTGLAEIIIPESVTYIGYGAFYGCTGLESITIEADVASIGSYAFYGCTGLSGIVIPDSVASIGDYAFSGCTGLSGIVIPGSVTSIGHGAFSGCTGLTDVKIESGVVSFGFDIFGDCVNIEVFDYSDNEHLHEDDGALYDENNRFIYRLYTILSPRLGWLTYNGTEQAPVAEPPDDELHVYDGVSIEYVGPKEVNAGTYYAKAEDFIITGEKAGKYRLPSNPEWRIAWYIQSSYSFEQIDGVWYQLCQSDDRGGTAALRNENWSVAIDLDRTSLYIPEAVVFEGASYTVISIGSGSFKGCTNLETVSIPGSVTSLSGSLFRECNGLKSISVGDNDSYASRDGALYNRDMTLLLFVPAGIEGDFVVPDGVESIDSNAFSGCSG